MSPERLVYRTRLDVPGTEVFGWHARPGALERLTPPWEPVEVLERTGGITNGSRVTLRLRLGPLRRRWVSEHQEYQENVQFCDVQIAGPFAHWEHCIVSSRLVPRRRI